MLIVIAILLLALFIFLSLKKPGIALVTSPIASILVAAAALEKSAGAMVIAPVIFLTTLIVVLMTRREPDSQQWPQIAAKCILIGIVISLFFMTSVVVFSIFGSGVLPFIFFLSLIIFIAFIGSLISYGLTSRHATAAYVISTIGSSMRQNLPLPMALESAASGRSDNRAKTLQAIKKWLVQGCSLSESIKRGYPNCPGYAVAMMAAAERIDQLPLAIKAIEVDMVARADERKKLKPVHPFYPIILIVFMFFIVLGLMWEVLPEFYSILTEITDEAALPAPTRVLIRFAHFIRYEYGWLIALALALIILAAVAVSIIVRFRPRRPYRTSSAFPNR